MKTRKSSILKRSLSLMLSLALLTSFCAMPAWARNNYSVGKQETSLVQMVKWDQPFYEDFEGEKSTANVDATTVNYFGLVNNNSYGATNGGGSNAYITPSGELLLDGNSTTEASFTINDKGSKFAVGSYWTVSFKFKLGAIGVASPLYLMDRSGKAGVRLDVDETGKLIYYIGTKSYAAIKDFNGTNVDMQLSAGKWYTVRIVVDTTTSDASTSTQSIYVNGKCLLDKGQLYNYANGFNQKMIRLFNAKTYTPVYYDDFIMGSEPVGRTTYSAEDFGGYSQNVTWNGTTSDDGAWWEGFTFANGPANVATINATEGRLEVDGSDYILVPQYGTTTDSRRVNVSFDFTPTDVSVSNGTIYAMVDEAGQNFGVNLLLSAGGVLSALVGDENFGSANYLTLKTGMQANQTYKITICADISENNCTKYICTTAVRDGHYSVYVDGECVASNIDFPYASEKGLQRANTLGRVFSIPTKAEDAPMTYYDNIVIYDDEREYLLDDAFATVAAGAEALKTGATTLTLPAGDSTYGITWTSNSDAIVVNGDGTATVTKGTQAQNVTLTAAIADTVGQLTLTRTINVAVPGIPTPSIADIVRDGDTTSVTATLEGTYNGVQLIAAVYDANKRLMGVDMAITDGTTASATVTMTNLEPGDYTTRMFVLDSIASLKPLIGSTDRPFSIE